MHTFGRTLYACLGELLASFTIRLSKLILPKGTLMAKIQALGLANIYDNSHDETGK